MALPTNSTDQVDVHPAAHSTIIDAKAFFGVTADGTADDTAEVQAALDAVDSNRGGTVILPVGRMKISAALTIKKNTHLMGAGAGVSFNEGLTSRPSVLEFVTNSQVGISADAGGTTQHQGFTIENIGLIDASAAKPSVKLIQIKNWNRVTLRNVSFRDALVAVEIDDLYPSGDSAWHRFEQFTIKACSRGIDALGIGAFLLTGSDIETTNYGIRAQAGAQFRVIGAKFDGGEVGIYNGGASAIIIGCGMENQSVTAIELDGRTDLNSAHGKGHKIIGCYFNPTTGVGAVGIKLDANVQKPVAIIGNNFADAGSFTEIVDNSGTDGGYIRVDANGLGRNPKTVSATTTLDNGHDVVLVDSSGGNRTINLPSATSTRPSYFGKTYVIKKISAANTVTIDPSGAQTIDGAATLALTAQWSKAEIVCDGANWQVIGS